MKRKLIFINQKQILQKITYDKFAISQSSSEIH